jgi:hypothetical protein
MDAPRMDAIFDTVVAIVDDLTWHRELVSDAPSDAGNRLAADGDFNPVDIIQFNIEGPIT